MNRLWRYARNGLNKPRALIRYFSEAEATAGEEEEIEEKSGKDWKVETNAVYSSMVD